ncbi:SDR family NAD(P)-dependent oxidoreductase [Nocardia sp. R16R-3T]
MSTAGSASVRRYPPVSIVGIGCRVPGASNVAEFWDMLCDGRDAIGAPPPGRPGTRHAGYLTDVDAFDNDWFAISGREAALMDPQQRLALEVAVEALDDAGIGYRTRGSGAAVVFGACAYDHGIAVLGCDGHDAPYAVTGSALSIIANRLSYVLDLHGPSLVLDSACSSSLAAVDLAVRLLADDAVPFAIVGGVNLALLPHTSEYLAEGGFLAPDGRCKPFDAAADGYTRGDGCTVVVLRRTADALRDGHRVYAEILGTAVGSDGRSNGLYAPNGRAQQDTIRTALARAGLDPHDVGYVECHGTGTPLGDAVEVSALAAVVGSAAEPTWIGSLKSNIGHLEAAAGITGMVKAALSIRHGVIPPTINFHTENPLLKLAEHGLRVPTEPVYWTGTPLRARRAGISSFGFGGTNAHVVLGGLEPERHRSYEPPVLLPVSGRDDAQLRARALRWAELLEGVRASGMTRAGTSSSLRTSGGDPVPDSTSRNGRTWEGTARDHPSSTFHECIRLTLPDDATSAAHDHITGNPPDGTGSTARTSGTDALLDRASQHGMSGVSGDGTDNRGGEGPGNPARAGMSSTAHEGMEVAIDEISTGYSGTGDSDREVLRRFAAAAARLIPENSCAAVVSRDLDDAVAQLRALAGGDVGAAVIGVSSERRRGGVLFLFSGQGGQHAKMGRSLAARYPVFAKTVTAAADAIAAAGGRRVWTPRNGFALSGTASNRTTATEYAQPAIFAFQVALAELLAAWGIEPDAVVGHSLGEVAGAAVSGALSLSDAARVVVQRSRILARLDGHGAMAVLETTADEAVRLVEPLHATVAIAAVNGPRSVVISGAPRYIDALVRRAKRRQIFAQRIAVDFAAHSPQVDALLPEFIDALDGLTTQVPRVPVYSTARRHETITTAVMDAPYWVENASRTVELAAALQQAADDGFATVLEIAPHPVLTPVIRDFPEFADATHAVTTRDNEAEAFLTCLGKLYLEGRPINWAANGPFTTPPPPRQWSRRHFPLITTRDPDTTDDATTKPGTCTRDDAAHSRDVQDATIGLGAGGGRNIHDANTTTGTDVGRGPDGFDSSASEVLIAESEFPAEDLHDHVVQGIPTVPAVFWLLRLLGLAGTAHVIIDFVVHERTELAALPTVSYRARGAGRLQAEVTGAGTLASARLAGDPTPADIVAWMRVVDANRAARQRMRVLTPGVFYDSLRARQLDYGPSFRALRDIAAGSDCAVGLFDSAPLPRSATLDSCLQLLAAASWDHLPADTIALPIGIESAWLSAEPDRVLLEAHALVRDRSTTGLTGDIIGTDQHGVPVLALSGVRIGFATVESTTQAGPFRHETWIPFQHIRHFAENNGYRIAKPRRALVIGESQLATRIARELDRTLPTERVAREPDAAGPIVSAVLAGRTGTANTAVIVIWPAESGATHAHATESANSVATIGRILDLLQRVQSEHATASLTIVLPYPGATDRRQSLANGQRSSTSPGNMIIPMAVAGLVRSMHLESGRDIRLVWTDTSPTAVSRLRDLIEATITARELPDELRLTADAITTRRFVHTRPRSTTSTQIDPTGTYVVTGGLGALGSVAVRWLLDAGAHDVVVLTRAPGPVPALLDGLEDRIVVVRCDAADRGDLANALNDVRECGSTIRGVVHAAGALEDAAFDAVTTRQLARMFAPKPIAASNLIELTATDPTDFVLLFSSATGALGAPGQAAYASANAAMDALARAHPGRRVQSIGWGLWDSGLAEDAGGAAHLRRAGISAIDTSRGIELLAQTMYYNEPYLLALDYTPTTDPNPVATRLRNLLTDQPPTTDPAPSNPVSRQHYPIEPLTATIRTVLASTLDLASDQLDPEADFNDLGLSSLLGIEMRRHLESRLNIRISTAELFQYPTITALGAALADRVAATRSDGVR